jgi:uncharacterized membrane protein YdjX (TVP38/TMEM64 family)
MNTKKFLVIITLLTLVIIYRHPLAELLGIISDQEAVSAYLKSYGALGPIVLFVLMVAQVFVRQVGFVHRHRQYRHRQSGRFHDRALVRT